LDFLLICGAPHCLQKYILLGCLDEQNWHTQSVFVGLGCGGGGSANVDGIYAILIVII